MPSRRKNIACEERNAPLVSPIWLKVEEGKAERGSANDEAVHKSNQGKESHLPDVMWCDVWVLTWVESSTECIDAHAPAAHADTSIVALVSLGVVGCFGISFKHNLPHEVSVEEQHPFKGQPA